MNSPNRSSKIIKISKAMDQTLSLPPSILNYNFKNANHSLIRRLFSTCKYFPKKYMIQILSELCVRNSGESECFEYRQKSLQLSINHSKTKNLKNLYIVTTFSYQDSNKISLCKFLIPKIHRCEAKHVDIWNQNLTWSDFKVIVSSEHVRQLYFEDVNILDHESIEIFPIENVISHCLNATSITINHIKSSNICCTKNTSKILADLKFQTKIKKFCIGGLNSFLDPKDLCDFVKNNAAPKSVFSLSFKPLPSQQYISKLQNQIAITINYWCPSKNKPVVDLKFM